MNIFDAHISGSLSVSASAEISGDLTILGGLSLTGNLNGSADFNSLRNVPTLVSSSSQLTSTYDNRYVLSGSITQTTWDNIASKPNGIVSGSSQVDVTSTTGYSTFSSSISSNINTLSSSVATTDSNQNTKISGLETASGSIRTDFNSFTSSNNTIESTQNSKLTSLETTTSSLNTFTSSINTTIKNKLDTDGVISGSAQVDITSTIGYSTLSSSVSSSVNVLSSSVATTDLNQSNKISSLETASGSIRADFNSFTSSNNTIETTQNNRLTSIETSTGSINTFTSSIDSTIKTKLNSDGVISGSSQVLGGTTIHSGSFFNGISIVSGSGQIDITSTTGYSTFSSSVATTDSNQNTKISGLETASGSIRSDFNTYTGSNDTTNTNQNSRLTSIESATGSLNTFTSSINTTIKTKLNTEGVISGSSQVLNGSGIWSGSSQLPSGVISGSSQLPSGLVSGSSQVDITSTTGYVTFSSSISMTDTNQNTKISGLETASGSIRTDFNVFTTSVNNSISSMNGAIEFTGSALTVKGDLLVKGTTTAIDSTILNIGDNVIQLNGTGATNAGIVVRDATSPNFISGSLLWDTTNDQWIAGPLGSEQKITLIGDLSSLNTYTGSANGRLTSIETSTGSLNTFTSSINTTIKSKLNTDGVISGSSQVLSGTGIWSGSAQLPSGVVSGSSQITYGSLTGIPSGIVSGSGQVSFGGISGVPTGLVSGSSQITFGSITGIPSGLVSGSSQVLVGSSVWSSSAQLPSGVVSGSGQIAFGSITGTPSGLVSGSSQVLVGSGIWSGSAQLPSGVVSGSSQVLSGTGIWSGSAQLPSGTVSGSSQITFGSITGIPSGLVSGSSQVTYGSLTGVPSGIVSGSSQITLSSTTGFGTYINQAVLTSSSPSFVGATFTGAGSASTGTINLQSSDSFIRLYTTGGTADKQKWDVRAISATSSESFEIRTINDANTVFSTKFVINNSGTVRLPYYSTDGFVKFNSSNGTLVVDTTAYLSSITSANVTTALGFTPYNATNPSGYITSAGTAANVSGTVAIANGGTGGTTAAGARTNLGLVIGTDVLAYRTFGTAASNNTGDFAAYNATHYVGTTAIAANRTSASQTLTGVSIDGTSSNITSYTINQSVGTGNSPTFAGITVNGTVIASQSGFQSATYSAGRNRIWSFGNADAYGISYFQGSGGYGGSTDMIGFHFGTASVAASKFTFVSDGRFITSGDILPSANNSYNLGSASLGWANVYTNDLHLSNMNKPEGNDIDGTSGTWTIQEGAENLYIINNRNGKKFKINLEEI